MHDRTLCEIAALLPASPQALLAVPGIGVAKAQRYGDALLAIVAERTQPADLQEAGNGAG